jgi:hypothetical protein
MQRRSGSPSRKTGDMLPLTSKPGWEVHLEGTPTKKRPTSQSVCPSLYSSCLTYVGFGSGRNLIIVVTFTHMPHLNGTLPEPGSMDDLLHPFGIATPPRTTPTLPSPTSGTNANATRDWDGGGGSSGDGSRRWSPFATRTLQFGTPSPTRPAAGSLSFQDPYATHDYALPRRASEGYAHPYAAPPPPRPMTSMGATTSQPRSYGTSFPASSGHDYSRLAAVPFPSEYSLGGGARPLMPTRSRSNSFSSAANPYSSAENPYFSAAYPPRPLSMTREGPGFLRPSSALDFAGPSQSRMGGNGWGLERSQRCLRSFDNRSSLGERKRVPKPPKCQCSSGRR